MKRLFPKLIHSTSILLVVLVAIPTIAEAGTITGTFNITQLGGGQSTRAFTLDKKALTGTIEVPGVGLQEEILNIVLSDWILLSFDVVGGTFTFQSAPPGNAVGDVVNFNPRPGFLPGTGTITSITVTEHTPEPTSTLSLLALGTLGAASTFKRKLKSSK